MNLPVAERVAEDADHLREHGAVRDDHRRSRSHGGRRARRGRAVAREDRVVEADGAGHLDLEERPGVGVVVRDGDGPGHLEEQALEGARRQRQAALLIWSAVTTSGTIVATAGSSTVIVAAVI